MCNIYGLGSNRNEARLMKQEITKTLATRIRFMRRCGWSIKRIMDFFVLSRAIVKKICRYEIEGEKDKK